MKIAVVGNRDGWESSFVFHKLNEIVNVKIDEIISGGAKGVDTFAQEFAEAHGMKITILYPNPLRPSPQRYYERNQDIVDMAEKVIAFQNNPHRSGTQSTINRTKKKGIEVIVIEEPLFCQDCQQLITGLTWGYGCCLPCWERHLKSLKEGKILTKGESDGQPTGRQGSIPNPSELTRPKETSHHKKEARR
jgi:predicted Rossmann fold nucleotide-binding protein DprA/Smf involved in DNA uptake